MGNLPQPNSVYTGDAFEIMAAWPDNSFDHCIADPPFGIASGRGRRSKAGLAWAFSSHITIDASWDSFEEKEFFEFNVRWLSEVSRLVKPNGNILVFGTYHNIYQLGFILQSILRRRILNSVVWYKPNAQPNITARTLTESTEQIIWAVNNTPEEAKNWTFNYWDAKDLSNGKQMRNVWFGDSDMWEAPVVPPSERKLGKHPSQKPLAITDRLVAIASRPGDLVLDCFAGTGAVGVSCVGLMRKYVLIDHEEKFARIAEQRIEAKANEVDVLLREQSLMTLTDAERKVLEEIPVPQADDIDIVFDVPRMVAAGVDSSAGVARELDYALRQGHYYADAAMSLGLIQDDRALGRAGRNLNPTAVGSAYLQMSRQQQIDERRRIVLSSPIIKFVGAQLGVLQDGQVEFPVPALLLNESEVARVLASLGASDSTSVRRAKTIVSWLSKI